jgi:hypothetical protein
MPADREAHGRNMEVRGLLRIHFGAPNAALAPEALAKPVAHERPVESRDCGASNRSRNKPSPLPPWDIRFPGAFFIYGVRN